MEGRGMLEDQSAEVTTRGLVGRTKCVPALRSASRVIELVSFELAGDASRVQVSELILLSSQLNKAADRLEGSQASN